MSNMRNHFTQFHSAAEPQQLILPAVKKTIQIAMSELHKVREINVYYKAHDNSNCEVLSTIENHLYSMLCCI